VNLATPCCAVVPEGEFVFFVRVSFWLFLAFGRC
jgi:hypothetical protein